MTMGTFGKYFDFLPGEKSTKFIDCIKQIKPVQPKAFGSARNSEAPSNGNSQADLPVSNIHITSKRLKLGQPLNFKG